MPAPDLETESYASTRASLYLNASPITSDSPFKRNPATAPKGPNTDTTLVTASVAVSTLLVYFESPGVVSSRAPANPTNADLPCSSADENLLLASAVLSAAALDISDSLV